MSITSQLFDRWKAVRGHKSDRAALQALGVSHGAAVHWRAGKNAEVNIIERMARDLGEDPLRAVADAMKEQARGADAHTWGRLVKRLGATAAALALVALPYLGTNASWIAAPSPVEQSAYSQGQRSVELGNRYGAMPIMSTARGWLRTAWTWITAQWALPREVTA